jgi:hypothetical protein
MLADKKKRKWLRKFKRLLKFMSIMLRSYISSSNKSNHSASKLTGEFALDRMIESFMQTKCVERLSSVPSSRRNLVTDVYKGLKGCFQVLVWFYNDLSRA